MNNLKSLRRKTGYKTVGEVSEILHISRGMLYQVEEGYKKPSVKLAKRMSELYKCSLDDIFEDI